MYTRKLVRKRGGRHGRRHRVRKGTWSGETQTRRCSEGLVGVSVVWTGTHKYRSVNSDSDTVKGKVVRVVDINTRV